MSAASPLQPAATPSPALALAQAQPALLPQNVPAAGHHWLMDLSGCAGNRQLLENAQALEAVLPAAARQAGMQVVGQVFHQFAPTGVTGAVILAESHVTIHTWPQEGFVAIDVYVCDFNQTNCSKGERLSQALMALFAPQVAQCRTVRRGAQAEQP